MQPMVMLKIQSPKLLLERERSVVHDFSDIGISAILTNANSYD
jgi:hypothetical protein